MYKDHDPSPLSEFIFSAALSQLMIPMRGHSHPASGRTIFLQFFCYCCHSLCSHGSTINDALSVQISIAFETIRRGSVAIYSPEGILIVINNVGSNF